MSNKSRSHWIPVAAALVAAAAIMQSATADDPIDIVDYCNAPCPPGSHRSCSSLDQSVCCCPVSGAWECICVFNNPLCNLSCH